MSNAEPPQRSVLDQAFYRAVNLVLGGPSLRSLFVDRESRVDRAEVMATFAGVFLKEIVTVIYLVGIFYGEETGHEAIETALIGHEEATSLGVVEIENATVMSTLADAEESATVTEIVMMKTSEKMKMKTVKKTAKRTEMMIEMTHAMMIVHANASVASILQLATRAVAPGPSRIHPQGTVTSGPTW